MRFCEGIYQKQTLDIFLLAKDHPKMSTFSWVYKQYTFSDSLPQVIGLAKYYDLQISVNIVYIKF